MILLKNGSVLLGGSLIKKDILIEGNLIKKIDDCISLSNCNVIDVSKCWVIPGTIDVHAHFREPGFEGKGTIYSESRSAAKGGITSAMAMPNLNPTPDCYENLQIEQSIIDVESVIKIYPYASVSKGELGIEVSALDELIGKVKGITDDGRGVNNIDVLKQAMRWAKANDVVISSHAEMNGYGTSGEAEYLAVERELALVKEIGCKYHFCHMSTERSFNAIEKAKLNGVDVTCEVTPHHLVLCEDDICGNTNFKMNPPLRSRRDMMFTIKALLTGVADMIATDHAPHSEQDKAVVYEKAPNGIIGFETLAPIIFTYFIKTGLASYEKFLNWLVYNPSDRFSILHSNIEEGSVADIAVLDIENQHTYRKDEILSKSKNSPFIGESLFGMNVLTLVDGKVVYRAI
ncbi:MAG: dihydroorotase [Clostridia bacterium]